MACQFVGLCGIPPEAQAAWAQAVLSVAGILVPMMLWRLDRRKSQEQARQQLTASRIAVQSLAVNELARLVDKLSNVFQFLPRYVPQGLEEPSFLDAHTIVADDQALAGLIFETQKLETPVLGSLVEKLDALSPVDLLELSQILQRITSIQQLAIRIERLTHFGARERMNAVDEIDNITAQCGELTSLLKQLIEKWNVELHGEASAK